MINLANLLPFFNIVFFLLQSSPNCSYTLGWVKYCLKIVENIADPSKVVSWELGGNQKVLKTCLELFSTFSEVERSKGTPSIELKIFRLCMQHVFRPLAYLCENYKGGLALMTATYKTTPFESKYLRIWDHFRIILSCLNSTMSAKYATT